MSRLSFAALPVVLAPAAMAQRAPARYPDTGNIVGVAGEIVSVSWRSLYVVAER